jgi:transketolase
MTSVSPRQDLATLAINAVRVLSMDAVQQANSGHPGTPMALAPLGYVLWTRHLRHNPADPTWPDRDRFILSAGHASMLLYSLLHLTGYDVSLEEIRNFRQWESSTPGHPEYGHTPGVETTTGPLGQGVGNAIGMAMAEAHLATLFNRPGHDIVSHWTYFVASDGDIMEGVSHEAASIAGHLRLGRLIGFYDDNHITIDGETELTFGDDTQKRFEGYGWQVLRVPDGNDVGAIDTAIRKARADARPSLIIVRTRIAYGSPNKVDTPEAHGAPLGEDEIRLTKENLGYPSLEPFYVPDEALAHWRATKERGAALQLAWQHKWSDYSKAHPDLAQELHRRLKGELPPGWEDALPTFTAKDGSTATRSASGKTLNALAPRIPELIGGAADLAGSTNTVMKDAGSFSAENYAGRNVHFGIREHGMGSVMNGMALHGGLIPFGGTFLVFSDYMRPPIRLAALMKLHTIYVFTHDSIGLGEDGPTHQPIEQLTALRCIPNLTVIRPADSGETVEAWRVALKRKEGPTALSLTRQKLAWIDRSKYAPASGVARGAYVIAPSSDGEPEVILMSAGSEVAIILEAREQLESMGIRTRAVSMPSHELFAAQPESYRKEVLPAGIKRVAIEAAHPMSWHRWVMDDGVVLGLERYGASAPYERVYEELGLIAREVVAAARRVLDR